ncbi:MAG: glutamine-hydrolyzing carbamoyl-phosphate synthase small subunit [Planctomycetota bacterium]
MTRKAMLALEDGSVFMGDAFGAQGQRTGEVVFNTSMTGYQEVLTDPSYRGQIVAMTYPLIGNYGVNAEDAESRGLWLEGFAVGELSRVASNHQSQGGLDAYLRLHGVIGIQGLDTRALTRRLRTAGALKGIISTDELDGASLVAKAKASAGLEGRDLASTVTCPRPYTWPEGQERHGREFRVVVLDCGVKYGILRCLAAAGCDVKVLPARTGAEEIAAIGADGLVLSNGPGDPAAVGEVIATVKELIDRPPWGRPLPIFGICLGQQILALALGGRTYKLKFGHHGANHPVKDLRTGKVAITTQNHGFCVDLDSLSAGKIEATHLNLNDQTLEGLRYRDLPIFSVQYHPEASPGPHDATYLFDEFVGLMKQAGA